MNRSMQSALAGLADPDGRIDAARALASELGGDDLVIFTPDCELGIPLPALGFPQTLPRARDWRTLIERSSREKALRGTLVSPFTGDETTALALAADDGTTIVVLGGMPEPTALEDIAWALPILGLAFRGERSELASNGRVAVAKQAADQAIALAATLDETRARLQTALDEAHAAGRAKDDFLAVVSHELRTPLTAILGWTRLARDEAPERATGGSMLITALDTIERNVQAQSRLVDDILDYARIVAGKLRLETSTVDLLGILRDAYAAVRTAAENHRLILHEVAGDEELVVNGDPGRLRQIIINLLSNAIKFTPSGGEVWLRSMRSGGHVVIEVEDTGRGIAPEFLPYVFDRFRQADTSAARQSGGLGLGLAIVRQLVDLHDGEVSAESPGIGGGAIFRVRLPLHDAGATIPADDTAGRNLSEQGDAIAAGRAPVCREAAGDSAAPKRLEGRLILVVEDSADSRALISLVLERHGAVVVAASTAIEALEAFARARPHVIVSDIGLPGMDGYELIRRIRQRRLEDGGRVPALALSAHTRPADRERMIAAGFDQSLGKPFDLESLVIAVDELSRNREPSVSTS